jgi:hypothetical protein
MFRGDASADISKVLFGLAVGSTSWMIFDYCMLARELGRVNVQVTGFCVVNL